MKPPFFLQILFSLNPCNIKPFATPHSALCLTHLCVCFILIAYSINSLKAEIILLCLTLRRHSVNACRIELNWIRISFIDAPSAIFFIEKLILAEQGRVNIYKAEV